MLSLKKMIPVTVLVLCGGAALAYPTTTMPEELEDSLLSGFIDASNDAVQLGARLASQLSANQTSTSIVFNRNLASITSTALKGYIDNFNKFLNVFSRFTSDFPVIGTANIIANSAIQSEANLLNKIGQNAIKTAENITNMNLVALDNVIQNDLVALRNASNFSSSVKSELVRNDLYQVHEGIQDSYDAFDSASYEHSEEDCY